VYFVGRTVEKWNVPVIVSFLIGTAIAIVISILNPATENSSFFYLMICGVVAICSMILPGLSGSFILFIMGNYKLVAIDAINNRDVELLIPVAIGAAVGLIAFSHFLSWVFKRYRNQTISLLTGFILGSVSILWPWQRPVYLVDELGKQILKKGELVISRYERFIPDSFTQEVIYAIIFIITGILSIWLIEKAAAIKPKTGSTNNKSEMGLSDYNYDLFPFENIEDLIPLINSHSNLIGFNVTTPHKINIIKYCSKLDEVAEMTGSVNCVKVKRSANNIELYGFNTDAMAFKESLKSIDINTDLSALILGNGGVSKTVAWVLGQMKIRYKLVSRRKQAKILSYNDLTEELIRKSLLLINTTTLGQFPDTNQCPALPYEAVSDHHFMYDLIYNPDKTLFLSKGLQQGAQIKNGMEMLYLQADISFDIWQNES